MTDERTTRYFALAVGIIYLLVGVVGFIPLFYSSPSADAPHLEVTAGYGYLLGVFPVNALHNVVHLLVGVLGLACSVRFASSRFFARGLFGVYGLLTFMGTIPNLDTVFRYIPIFNADVALHAATAIAAGIVGWVISEPNVPAEVEAHAHP